MDSLRLIKKYSMLGCEWWEKSFDVLIAKEIKLAVYMRSYMIFKVYGEGVCTSQLSTETLAGDLNCIAGA